MTALPYRPKRRSPLALLLFALCLLLAATAPHPPSSVAAPHTQTATTGPTILIPPWGATDAADRLWSYQDGVWTPLTIPSPGRYWSSIVADPSDPDRWLLMGNSVADDIITISGNSVTMRDGVTPALWYTLDAGVTWQPIAISTSIPGRSAIHC
jgi:hypothetical protein